MKLATKQAEMKPVKMWAVLDGGGKICKWLDVTETCPNLFGLDRSYKAVRVEVRLPGKERK